MSLRNNVSTIEMQMTCQEWPPGTEEFVPHHVLADYIEDAARSNAILNEIRFNTRVDKVEKVGNIWEVDISSLEEDRSENSVLTESVVRPRRYQYHGRC